MPALTGSDQNILQPKIKQAEFFTELEGVEVVTASGASGGKRVGYIDDGDWIKLDPVNLVGVDSITYRVSSGGPGGTIEARAGALDGPVVHTVEVPNTGGWDSYTEVGPVEVTDPGGTQPLYLVFHGEGDGGLFDVDVLHVNGAGVAQPGTSPAECEPVKPDWRVTGCCFDGPPASLEASRISRSRFLRAR